MWKKAQLFDAPGCRGIKSSAFAMNPTTSRLSRSSSPPEGRWHPWHSWMHPFTQDLTMEQTCSNSPPISLLGSGSHPSTDSIDSAPAENAIEQGLFLPITAEEQPRFTASSFSPIDACMTSGGPIVTPDACPLLSFEHDRRVRFRDCDEEWLLTEEISVASASARCSEEASAAEASTAKPEPAFPGTGAEGSYDLMADRGHQSTDRKCRGPGRSNQEQFRHPQARPLPRNETSGDSSFDCTLAAVSPEGTLVGSTIPGHLWWPSRGSGSGIDSEQHCFSGDATPGSRTETRRGRRHTAPGGLKTALIRSADGSLRRRPLHSPPCLTTSHPPKSCVRPQSESSVFPAYCSHTSIATVCPSAQRTAGHQGLPMYMPHMGSQIHVVLPRRLRAMSGPCLSSVMDSSPLGHKTRPYRSHVSQPGALVDIAAWEID